jgi:hypothetical protein
MRANETTVSSARIRRDPRAITARIETHGRCRFLISLIEEVE